MSQDRGQWLDTILIGLLFVVITGFYTTALIDPVMLPKFLGWGVALILSGVTLLLYRSPSLLTPFQNNPVVWALTAYVLISALTLLKSHNLADGSFEWFKGFFLLVFVVLLLAQFGLKQQFLISGVIAGAVGLAYVGGAFGFYQLVAVAGESGLSHTASYAVSGTFAHRNLYAEVLFLTLPFSLYGFQLFRGLWRWLCLGGAFIALLIIVMLMSRAVWVAVIAAAIVPSVLYLGLALLNGQLWATLRYNLPIITKVLAGIALTIGISVLIYTQFEKATALKKQVVSIFQFNFTYGSIQERINLWSKSWEIIKEHPLAGIGPGDWEQALLAKGNQGILSANNKTFFQRPHNDFLWVCSESGIPGLLAYAGSFAGAGLMLLRPLYADPWNPAYRLNYFLLAALAGYGTYALFSFPKERIEHQMLLGFVLVLTSFQAGSSSSGDAAPTSKRVTSKVLLGGSLLVIGFGLFLGLERLKAEAAMHKALQARLNQQPKQVIQHVRQARSPFYRIDPMSTPLPWYSGSAHYKLGSYKKALADFKAAYQLNPHHMHVVNNLATLHQKTGSTDSAIYYYKKALSLSPKFTAAALNLAALYYNQNQYQKALRAIRQLAYQPEHDKYKKYLTAILKARGNAIEANLPNKLIASTVHRILGTDRWLLAVYKKSLTAYTFRHQLIEDAIYALHKQEKAISLHQADTFRKKYLNDD